MWKPLLWVAHHLLLIAILAAFAVLIGARNRQSARALTDGRIEFAVSRTFLGAWVVIAIAAVYLTIDLFKRSSGNVFTLVEAACVGLIAAGFLFEFPGTLLISSEGLQQVRWPWRNKRIRWQDIVEINTGKKDPTVTVTGADGTKIAHAGQLPDRPRFLLELKQHCGENLPADFPREPIIPLKNNPPL